MANITSTTRPITSGSNVTTPTANTTGVATESLENTPTVTKVKQPTITPTINQYSTTGIKQQAIDTKTGKVVHENRYLYNTSNVPRVNNTSVINNSDRSNISILSRWGNTLRARNNSNLVTTYSDDNTSVPLLRRDTTGFFNVDYNSDGTYHVTTTGIKIPFTDTVVGNYDLGNFSWNPVKAYAVASPIGIYLTNYSYYDTKNKIVQGAIALANSYSNYYDGHDNFVDNYAIKEWGNLVDMSVNWKDRNIMQNAVAGLNTITGLSTRYGLNEYLGGDNVVGGIQNTLALYTFGNSMYNLAKYWDKMSVGQQVGALLTTTNAGVQAYGGVKNLYNMYSKLTEEAAKGTVSGAGSTASRAIQGSGSTASRAIPGSGSTASGAGSTTKPTTSGSTQPTNGGGVEEGTSTDWLGGAQKALGAAAAGYTSYQYGRTMGLSDTESGIGGATTAAGMFYGDPYSMSAVFAYQSIRGFCENGRGTAKDRKHGAVAGASNGAMIGAQIGGPAGAAVGAVIGAAVGTLSQSGKFGASREEAHRRLYRDALVQTGVFERFDEGFEHKGTMTYQLADGQYYDVGKDGSGSRALDINGNVKKYYNTDLIAEGDKIKSSGEMLPYNVDYTCNMDYTGSLMLAPLNALGLGGSNTRDSGEYGQMLGYMTNAVTSNVGREFTKDNFSKMIDNIKAGYERVGITNKQEALNALGLSYMMGNLTDDDYNSFKLGVDILYSSDGYNKAQTLMDQLGRGEQTKAEPFSITSGGGVNPETPTIEISEELIEKDTPTEESVSVRQELEQPKEGVTNTDISVATDTERLNSTGNKPIPETATEDVEQTQITEDMNSETGNNQEVQA